MNFLLWAWNWKYVFFFTLKLLLILFVQFLCTIFSTKLFPLLKQNCRIERREFCLWRCFKLNYNWWKFACIAFCRQIPEFLNKCFFVETMKKYGFSEHCLSFIDKFTNIVKWFGFSIDIFLYIFFKYQFNTKKILWQWNYSFPSWI